MIGSNPNSSNASSSSSSASFRTDISSIREQTTELLKKIRAEQNVDFDDDNFTSACEQAEMLLNRIENKTQRDWLDLALVCENLCAIYFAKAGFIANQDQNKARSLVCKSFVKLKSTIQAYANINESRGLQVFFDIITDRLGLVGRQQIEFICKMWITVLKRLNLECQDSPIERSTTFRPIIDALIQKWSSHNNSRGATIASSSNPSFSSSLASSVAASSQMVSHSSATTSSSSNFSSVLASLENDQSPQSPLSMLHDSAQIVFPTPKSSAAAQMPTPQSLSVAQTLAASFSLKQEKKATQQSAFTRVILPSNTLQPTDSLVQSMASLQSQDTNSSTAIGSTAQLTSASTAPAISQLFASLSPSTEQLYFPTFQSPPAPRLLTPSNNQNQNLLNNPPLLAALMRTSAAVESKAVSMSLAQEHAAATVLPHTDTLSLSPMSSTATSAVVSDPIETALAVSSPLTMYAFFNNSSQSIIEPSLLSLSPKTLPAITGLQAETAQQNSGASVDFSTTVTSSINHSATHTELNTPSFHP